jgi:NodT family efflux transporter outer membrane factor (OMF) lipoprotein
VIYNFHTAQVSVGYTPDVFGGVRRRVESLQAQAQVQRFQLEATYISLAANVVAAALQEASVQAQLQATQRIIAFNEKSLDIIHEKQAHGYASQWDEALQTSQLEQSKATLPPLKKQLEQTRDLLRALVGKLPNQDLGPGLDLNTLTLPKEIPLSLPAKIIEQRPDVRAAEEQLRSANAQVGAAVANLLPQFSISGVAGGNASQFGDMFATGGPFWGLIGGITLPIFDGGTLLHTKRAAEQAVVAAAAQYQSTVLTAYQNVADSLHALINDADTLAAFSRAQAAAARAAELAREQQSNGFIDYASLWATEISYQQATLSLVQAKANRFGDTIALYQALGGGWWNRADPTH